jgi:hypothetical protein
MTLTLTRSMAIATRKKTPVLSFCMTAEMQQKLSASLRWAQPLLIS